MREQSSFNEADLQVPGRIRTQCLAGGQVCVRVRMCVFEPNTQTHDSEHSVNSDITPSTVTKCPCITIRVCMCLCKHIYDTFCTVES